MFSFTPSRTRASLNLTEDVPFDAHSNIELHGGPFWETVGGALGTKERVT
jgi:hypothetical protein